MRQGNGTELLEPNDPRGAGIGIIYVAATDERKDVLAAILTQERLNRKQVAIILPQQNKSFKRPQDFDDLKSAIKNKKIRTEILFVTPGGPGPAHYARQRRFTVYSSLESYTKALQNQDMSPEEKGRTPRRSAPIGEAAAGAAAGAALAGMATPNPPPTPPEHHRPQVRSLYADQKTTEIEPSETPARQQDNTSVGREGGAGGALAAGTAGAAAGWMAANALNKSQNNENSFTDDEDALPPIDDEPGTPPQPSGKDIPDTPAQKDNEKAKSAAVAGAAAAGVAAASLNNDGEIIELRPHRATKKLPTSPIAPAPVAASASVPATPTRQRSTNKMAAAAGAGALAGASVATASRTVASRPPLRGGPPPRGAGSGGGGRGRFRLLAIIALIILTILIGTAIAFSAGPQIAKTFMGNNSAKITVTPDSRTIDETYIIQAVNTENPDPEAREVSLRTIESTPDPQTQEVKGTGEGVIEAEQAIGEVLFENSSLAPITIDPVTFNAGEVTVTTNEQVVIPAGERIDGVVRPGKQTVAAHVNQAGTAGNIPAGSIGGTCCGSTSVYASNLAAFTGGQNASNYTFVSQADIDAVANPIKETLSQQAEEGIRPQLEAGEQLAGAPDCGDAEVVVDEQRPAGDTGVNIADTSITVSATCIGRAFDHTGANQIASDLLQNDQGVTELIGQDSHYTLAGNVITQVSILQAGENEISLSVFTRGIWYYQFTDEQKRDLASKLAGKPRDEAQRMLDAYQTVGEATIDGGDTLPGDPAQITIEFTQVTGATSESLPQPTGTAVDQPGDGTPGIDENIPKK